MTHSYTHLQQEILRAIDDVFPKRRPWEAHNEPKVMEAVRKGILKLIGEIK